jgi:5-formyltetrahydrofolate cyclo-ligase
MTKKEIRKNMKSLKSKLTREQVIEYSDKIYHRLKEFISFEKYNAIYTYVAFNEEVQTNAIIEYAFHNNIKLAVPKIENKQMDFYYIRKKEDLKVGFYGILEPNTNQIAKDNHILMIMPGLAFDKECNRIGYGAGYYDTYLLANHHITIDKVALTYDFQLIDQLEVEPYDIKVDYIITPTKVIHRRSD